MLPVANQPIKKFHRQQKVPRDKKTLSTSSQTAVENFRCRLLQLFKTFMSPTAQKKLSRTASPQTGDPQRTAYALLGEGPGSAWNDQILSFIQERTE